MFQQNIAQGPGSGTYTQHTFEILIMLLGAFLLGLWLGWILWNRYKQLVEKVTLENQSLLVTADALRAETAAAKSNQATAESNAAFLNTQVESLNDSNSTLRAEIAKLEEELAATAARNRQVETELGLTYHPEDAVEKNDIPLEIETNPDIPVEEEPAEAPLAGETVAAASLDEDDNRELAGMAPVEDDTHLEAFTIEAPESDMHTLENEPEEPAEPEYVQLTPPSFTAIITPVPEPEAEVSAPALTPSFTATITPMPEPPIGAVAGSPDDLTVVEGIGPKIQELLYQYGIHTYRQLAETDVARLREILSSAGPQLAMHDPGTWPSQANLAANDEWDNLKAIQKFLKGGKKPT